jgi:uncharacterized protein YozE (UPF0346 family)
MDTTTRRKAEDPAQGQVRDRFKEERNRSQNTTPDQALDQFLHAVKAPTRRGPQRELARDGFTVWLIAQQHREDWIGHLAKQVAYDTTWPRGQVRLRELHDYLHDLYAESENHAALDQSWGECREVAV